MLLLWIGRIGAQLLVVEIIVDGIEAEAIDAALEPEAHDIEHRILHGRIVEVEIGLADQEIVQIVLATRPVPLPDAAAKDRRPVIGRAAIGQRIGPDIPVGAGIGAREAAFLEPGMLVGGVADHLIHDDLEAAGMGLGQKGIEILERAEERIDLAIVRDVIAHVVLGRLGDRGEPDAVDAQAGNVIEPGNDAGQIANAIAIAVLKRAGIDLIDHAAAPPLSHCSLHIMGVGESRKAHRWHSLAGPARGENRFWRRGAARPAQGRSGVRTGAGKGGHGAAAFAQGEQAWHGGRIAKAGHGAQEIHAGDDGSIGAIGLGATEPAR